MTDQHSHLRRLVETTAMRENAVNHDPMIYLQQLAGMRSTLPSLEEASEMQNFEVGGYNDPSAAHEKAMKIKMKGGKSIRIDKKSGKWVITYTATSKLHEDAEDIELPEAAVSGASPVIPDLSKWKTKIVGKGVVSRSIELQGKVVNVIERGEPKGSGLYRYTLYIDGKKIGKQDFTDTKGMFRTIKTAVVEGVEFATEENTRFSFLVKRSRGTIDEGRPYDPAEDPRRFTDKMLYDFMDMAAEVGGEDRIKLSRAAYKKYSAALREMKNRKLPMKRPPASDFDSNGAYMKVIPGAKGGVRPKGESVDSLAEAVPLPVAADETEEMRQKSSVLFRLLKSPTEKNYAKARKLVSDMLFTIARAMGALSLDERPILRAVQMTKSGMAEADYGKMGVSGWSPGSDNPEYGTPGGGAVMYAGDIERLSGNLSRALRASGETYDEKALVRSKRALAIVLASLGVIMKNIGQEAASVIVRKAAMDIHKEHGGGTTFPIGKQVSATKAAPGAKGGVRPKGESVEPLAEFTPEGWDTAQIGLAKALRRADYMEGDVEKTASSVVKAILQNKVVMEYLWGLPKHVRSESFLRNLIVRPLQKWLRASDGNEDPEMAGLVDEVLPMLLPSARSDAMTVRKHVRFAGMREAKEGAPKDLRYYVASALSALRAGAPVMARKWLGMAHSMAGDSYIKDRISEAMRVASGMNPRAADQILEILLTVIPPRKK